MKNKRDVVLGKNLAYFNRMHQKARAAGKKIISF